MFTNQWCQCDTVFIDHFSKIVTDQCSAQTLKENQAYKQIISKCRVRIHHYPCNNVLSLDTGLVSPQCHCRYDDLFKTISLNKLETIVTKLAMSLRP
ncbi:hypothetical protein ACHAW6_008638 [Cyclotella cf. meneghiniana]